MPNAFGRVEEAVLSEEDRERFLRRALEAGAHEAKYISPRDVVTAHWVRLKCQYGCGAYGERLTCPPYSPTPETTRRMLDEYHTALLLHFKPGRDVRRICAELEREIFLAGYYKAFSFACGPCNLCEECPAEGCRYPRYGRPAMEAAGIDVFATARRAGFPIEVVASRECDQDYYGLVLID